MILLAIDTALAACSACVYDSTKNQILAQERQLMERGHAEALPPMVARVMREAGIAYKTLNRIVVTTGPGSFTGIRIGLSFARALGLSLNLPVLGIDTPTALQFADPQDGLSSAAGFAAYAANLPDPETMPNPNYLRDADAKPQTAKLRGLPDLKIQLASLSDVPAMAKLHASSFAQAWTEVTLTDMLQTTGTAALVATSAEGPAGFLIYRGVADEAEILTFCVDPNLRGRGAGSAVLESLLALNFKTIFLEVASGNLDAVKLYQHAGFQQVGLRKAYYAATGEDALVLRWAK